MYPQLNERPMYVSPWSLFMIFWLCDNVLSSILAKHYLYFPCMSLFHSQHIISTASQDFPYVFVLCVHSVKRINVHQQLLTEIKMHIPSTLFHKYFTFVYVKQGLLLKTLTCSPWMLCNHELYLHSVYHLVHAVLVSHSGIVLFILFSLPSCSYVSSRVHAAFVHMVCRMRCPFQNITKAVW